MRDALFGIYLHWPYCRKVCPYCDFNVYAAKSRDFESLLDAICLDLKAQHKFSQGKTVTSIYFGGGTPSLLPESTISKIIETISQLWPVSEELEITLETNPEDVSTDWLRDRRAAGINRLSLGIQSINAEALTFLGRGHTGFEAIKAAEASLNVFENTSLDLIYARPGQSAEDWFDELGHVLALGAPHLSLYELTIKEKTAFANQVRRKAFIPMSEDEQADLYAATLELTAQQGLPAYEVSNHARSEACWSRHNLTYWLGGDWLGIGPGASGRISTPEGRLMTEALTKPADYISALQSNTLPFAEQSLLSQSEDANERLIMGLRAKPGVSKADLESLFGETLPDQAIRQFQASGHLLLKNDRLRLTETGWLFADHIAAALSP